MKIQPIHYLNSRGLVACGAHNFTRATNNAGNVTCKRCLGMQDMEMPYAGNRQPKAKEAQS